MSGRRLEFEPIARSPAHRHHVGLGARFFVEARWEIPASYGPSNMEEGALREGLALADISARGKLDLRGPIEPLLGSLAGKTTPRGAVATLNGGDSVPMHVARLSGDWAVVLSEPSVAGRALRSVEAAAGRDDVLVTNVSGLLAGFAVCGPKANELLSRLTAFDTATLAPGSCLATRVAEVSGILVRHWPPDGIVELYVGSEYGRFAWETLLDLGRGLGVLPVGWNTLRATGWW